MTTNKRIAEWLGWKKGSEASPLAPDEPPLEWWTPEGKARFLPFWDRYNENWHGKNGLLAEIEKRGPAVWLVFITALIKNMGPRRVIVHEDDGSDWVEIGTALMALESTPKELTAALIEVIAEK